MEALRDFAISRDETRYRGSSEELARLLLDSTGEGIYGIDLLGRCTFANAACLRMFGYRDQSEILGRSVHAATHHSRADGTPNPVEACAVYREGLHGEGTVLYDEVLWRKDGSSFPAEMRSFPLRRGGERVGAVVSFIDITARKKADEQIHLLHAITRAASEAPDLDAALEVVLRLICEATGISMANAWMPGSPGQLKLRGHWCRPADRERFRPFVEGCMFSKGTGLLGQACANKEPIWIADLAGDPSCERGALATVLGLRAGFAFPILVSGELVAVLEGFLPRPAPKDQQLIGLFSAVAAQIGSVVRRRRAEDALLRSEARFNRLSESGIIAITVRDRAGKILEANDTFLKMVAADRAELEEGRLNVFDLTAPEHLQNIRNAFEEVATWGAAGLVENEYLRRDGMRVPVLVGSAVLDENNVISFSLDITERKRLERVSRQAFDLEVQNRRMQEATRLKSEFLANMSHELRTPLNAVIGFGELLYDGLVPASSPKHHEYLGDIVKSGRHLLHLINDILDLAKVEAGRLDFRPAPVDLALVICEVTSIVRGAAEAKGIKMQATVAPELKEGIFLDPLRLKQILYNFVSNALKFTGPRGAVSIRASPQGEEMFLLEVEDTGIGIAAEDIERLFVEFQQLDAGMAREHSGTGLGLSLTRRLAEAQGGSVGVTSTPGKGSVFHVKLPRRSPAPKVRERFTASPAARR